MTKQVYSTGTIELMPYQDQGEFCIVGVFAVNAERRELSYKILDRQKTKRLTGFFPEMERVIFTQTLKSVHDEWEALAKMFNQGGNTKELEIMHGVPGSDIFSAITHPRGGMIRHQSRGVTLVDDIDDWLEQAFTKMVMRRNLKTILPEEQKLTRQVGDYLKQLKIKKHWKEHKVGNEIYHAQFPFAHIPAGEETVDSAIKPLYLGHDSSTKIMDHGDTWLQKVRRLNQFKLMPETLIFPVERPSDENSERYEHADIVINDLRREGVHVLEEMNLEAMKPMLLTDVVSDTPLFAREG
jgi:hypothetical protein